MKKRIYIKVYGDVIGVNFRNMTSRRAQEPGVLGWVRNYSDQTVEIEAEGEEDKLKELLTWANQGPEWARVDKVEYSWLNNQDEFTDFTIRY